MLRLPPPAPDTPSIDELQSAFERAAPDTERRWGTMTCAQMLRHCRRFAELYLGRVHVALPMRLLARVLGPFFLRRTLRQSPTATPRNLSTLPTIRQRGPDDLDFEAERAKLLEILAEVQRLEGVHAHPLYGDMDADDVIALVRHHSAHHANQFGLLVDRR